MESFSLHQILNCFILNKIHLNPLLIILLIFFIKDIEFPNLSKVNDIIEQLNLKNINYKKRLSGGEIRKIYIAKSILSESDILLLDEPTNHIDLPAIDWLERKLLYLKELWLLSVMIKN